MHAPSNAVLMLIGNKADLEDKRMVNFERAERLASQLGVSLYEVFFLLKCLVQQTAFTKDLLILL